MNYLRATIPFSSSKSLLRPCPHNLQISKFLALLVSWPQFRLKAIHQGHAFTWHCTHSFTLPTCRIDMIVASLLVSSLSKHKVKRMPEEIVGKWASTFIIILTPTYLMFLSFVATTRLCWFCAAVLQHVNGNSFDKFLSNEFLPLLTRVRLFFGRKFFNAFYTCVPSSFKATLPFYPFEHVIGNISCYR